MAVQGSGSAAELAASRKQAKYVDLQSQPTAVETLGPINESACAFWDDLGRRISLFDWQGQEAHVSVSASFNRCPALQRGSST